MLEWKQSYLTKSAIYHSNNVEYARINQNIFEQYCAVIGMQPIDIIGINYKYYKQFGTLSEAKAWVEEMIWEYHFELTNELIALSKAKDKLGRGI